LVIFDGVIQPGANYATRRLNQCSRLLEGYGICFPPLRKGTINIKLEHIFRISKGATIETIFIPREEILQADPNHTQAEDWWFVSLKRINRKKRIGWIYKTSTNYWGNSVIELLAEDLGDEAKMGNCINIELLGINRGNVPLNSTTKA